MRKTLVVITAFVLSSTIALAQEITLSPKLREGDEFRLEISRVRTNSARPQQNGKSRTMVDVRVVSATAKGFELDWVQGETQLDNPLAAKDPLILAAAQAVRDIRFRLKMNAEGELEGLGNQAEVVPKLQAIMDAIVKEMAARLPAEQRKAFEGFIAQVLSPGVLIASATREAEIYFGLNGVALSEKETLEADMQVPSPVGGGVLPATFRVLMESANPESASLKTTTIYDPQAILRMTHALAQQAGISIPAEELAKTPAMKVDDDGKYFFDRRLGLMREVIVDRRISAGDMRRHDGWEIRLVNGPTIAKR